MNVATFVLYVIFPVAGISGMIYFLFFYNNGPDNKKKGGKNGKH